MLDGARFGFTGTCMSGGTGFCDMYYGYTTFVVYFFVVCANTWARERGSTAVSLFFLYFFHKSHANTRYTRYIRVLYIDLYVPLCLYIL